MYQSIILITTLLAVPAFANQAEISKLYGAYLQEQKHFITGVYTRQNIAEKLVPFEKLTNEIYEKITVLEVNEKLELSPEGSQIALENELLSPLSTFAKSSMTADDCGAKLSEAQSNGADEVMGAFVIKTLKALCN